MKAGNATGSAARLSKFWDGSRFDLTRAGAEPIELCGRRVSLHMMIQPRIAEHLFSNKDLLDQGFLSRFLPAWPESQIGARQIDLESRRRLRGTSNEPVIEAFSTRIKTMLNKSPSLLSGDPQELKPRILRLSSEADEILVTFHNRVETAMSPDQAFSSITGFASKAVEHAARIAVVMTIYDDDEAREITESGLRNAKKFPTSCFVTPDWNDDQKYEFEERAAIIEFDGQLPRDIAEFVAAGILEKKVQRSK